MSLVTSAAPAVEKPQNPWDPNYVVSEKVARAIEEAVPDKPIVAPTCLRRLLVYGRKPTHPQSVACCFVAIEALGKKTGAFQAVASGDPLVFMLPVNFKSLSDEEKAAASEREAMLQKSLLDFVAGGKGIVGIHAALATGWQEYLEMMGGPFGGHITGQVWGKPVDPEHPVCAPMGRQSFQVRDEIYVSKAKDFREGLRVLLTLDLERMTDPGERQDGDYVISWVRRHGKGRVFYCSLGHEASSYYNPHVLRHYLAGIQFALGDLDGTVTAENPISLQAAAQGLRGYITTLPPESSEMRRARHETIARRRVGPVVIVHRGAWDFAPENTLEAYSAAMDHGADGCEIDLRRTNDGVLVMFHDDGMDRMTDALGRINQHSYAELLAIPFRSVYKAKPDTRIPTLASVLELARERAMLLHLDVKEPGLEEDITKLLDAADMWDHVVEINEWNASSLRKHPKFHRLPYKAFGWQEGRMDMNPERVREGLTKPGNMLMVDDPRVAGHELKRTVLCMPIPDRLRTPLPPTVPDAASQADPNSMSPTAYLRSLAKRVNGHSLDELEKLLATDLSGRTDFEGDAEQQQRRARQILERAWAAQQIGQLEDRSPRAVRLLEELVAQRSLHRDWAYSGLDGGVATRTLAALRATESVPFLVQTFQADAPELKEPVEPQIKYAYTAAAYRVKREIICALGDLLCKPSKQFLCEYLSMDESNAARSAGPFFEDATRALLRQQVTADEIESLLRSENAAVRGATILACLDDRTANRISLLHRTLPWTRVLSPAGK
jgi:uncharacterized protein